MAVPSSFEHLCQCGWRGDTEPDHSRCPQCGALVTTSVISAIELSADDPNTASEMAFTAKQVTYKWPRGFWHRIGERLERGEIVINQRTMGRILQHVTSPPPSRVGQKPGPLLVTSAEAFQRALQDGLARLQAGKKRVNKTNLALQCRWSRGTLYNYEELFQIDVQAVINDFLRSQGKGKGKGKGKM
jgi:hypothetical protein